MKQSEDESAKIIEEQSVNSTNQSTVNEEQEVKKDKGKKVKFYEEIEE